MTTPIDFVELDQPTPAEQTRELRLWLEEAGVKQTDLAQALGVSESLISLYVKGRRPLAKGFAARAKAALVRIIRERGERLAVLAGAAR